MNDSKISQIKIGKHRVGIIGLETVLEKVSRECENKSDEFICATMFQLLSKKNYIAETVHEQYKRAFIREYKKYMGLSVEKTNSWLEIKILGGGCNICNSLENTVMEVLSELNLPADVEHITQKDQIRKYDVQDGPALVINQNVVANGIIPLKQEIKSLLGKFHRWDAEKKESGKQVLVKNIPFSELESLAGLVDYCSGQIVSRTFVQNSSVSITLFAFDKGEKINTHTASGDAMLQVLDGEALVTINNEQMTVLSHQTVVMPADIPHSVAAPRRFKMLLTVVKRRDKA